MKKKKENVTSKIFFMYFYVLVGDREKTPGFLYIFTKLKTFEQKTPLISKVLFFRDSLS